MIIKYRLRLLLALAGMLLLLFCPFSQVRAQTFVNPSTITIDGTFTDWGTTGSPSAGVYLYRDLTNTGILDGSGFSGTAADLNYVWSALSTASGGTTNASPSNLIQHIYYRIDTFTTSVINPGQLYNIQLNLGVAPSGKADHLLQIWVRESSTPKVTIVLYSYNTPYPSIGAFTTGAIAARVSNVAGPFPGYTGTVDTNATGSYGLYDGTHYGIEVKIPVSWYSSTYGGLVKNNGSGAPIYYGSTFTSTGNLGSVGTIKDTMNDNDGKPVYFIVDTENGEVEFEELKLVNIVATKTDSIFSDVLPTGTISPGDVLLYTVVITNQGVSTADNVIFQDTITDPNLIWADNVTVSPSRTFVNNSNGVQVNIGNMSPGGTVTITFRAQIKSTLPSSIDKVSNQGLVSGSNFASVATDDPRTSLSNDATISAVTPTDMVEPYKIWSLTTDADGNGYPSPGDTLTYTVTLENLGNIAATNVLFTDIPDANSTFLSGSVTTTSGTVTKGNSSGDNSVTVNVGTIPGGQQTPVTITFRVIVNSPLTAGVTQLSNQGFVTGSNFPADPTDDPTDQSYDNPTITPLTAEPLVEAFKRYKLTDDINSDGLAGPGDNLTYVITIENKGNQAASGIFFSDSVDPRTTLITGTSITSQGAITSETTGGLTVDVGTMPGGNYAVNISFKVSVNAGATGILSNQGTVTATGLSNVLTDDPNTQTLHDATYTALTASPASLHVSKSVLLAIDADNDNVPSPGDTLQYIVAINNNGGSAADNVTLIDGLDPYTTLVPGSVTASQPASITEMLTSFTADIGTLEGGTVHSVCLITFRTLINNPLPTGTTIISNQGTVTAAGGISMPTDDPNTDASPDPTITTAYAHPLVTATKIDSIFTDSDSNSVPSPGDTLLYTIFIANNGNTAAESVVFYDAIADANLVLDDHVIAPPGASIILGNNPSDHEVQVSLGNIAVGDNRTITFHATINNPLPDGALTVANQGTVSGSNFTSINTDDPSTSLTNDATITALTSIPLVEPYKSWELINDADSNGYPSPGDTIKYTVIIENTGNQNASSVVFTDTPDPNSALVSGSVTTSLGAVTQGNAPGNSSVAVNLGTLPGNHSSANITFSVKIASPLPPGVTELSNQGFVSGANFPSDPTDDPSDELYDNPTITPLTASPLIRAFKHWELVSDIAPIEGTPGPGDVIGYTITIINNGNQNAASVSFSDTPGDNTTLNVGSVVTSQGTVTLGNTGGDTSVAVNLGTIAGHGGTATVSFNVTVKDNGSTFVSNQGTVSGINFNSVLTDDPGTTQQRDSTDTHLSNESVPSLHVTKTVILSNDADNDRVPSPGDTLQYIITINNNGNGAADNITFNDTPDPSSFLVNGSVFTTQGTIQMGNGQGDTSVRVNIPTLGAGSINLVTYKVTIRSGLPLSINTISNQGLVSSNNCPCTNTGDPHTGYSDNITVIRFFNRPLAAPAAQAVEKQPVQSGFYTTPHSSTLTTPYQPPVKCFPNLVVECPTLQDTSVKTGTPTVIDVIVVNKGNAGGSTNVSLYVNGQVKGSRIVSLSSNSYTQVSFIYSTDIPGEYNISVNNKAAGVLSVEHEIDPILMLSIICILSSLLLSMIMIWKSKQAGDS